jgi:hypothetical protein
MLGWILAILVVQVAAAATTVRRDVVEPSAAFWVIAVVAGVVALVLVGMLIYWCCVPVSVRRSLVQGNVPDAEKGHMWGSPTAYQGVLARIKFR